MAIEENVTLQLSVLDAMTMLYASWHQVTSECIVNCFAKAGICQETQENALNDHDDPFKDLQDSLDELKKLRKELVPDEIGKLYLFQLEMGTVRCSDRSLLRQVNVPTLV